MSNQIFPGTTGYAGTTAVQNFVLLKDKPPFLDKKRIDALFQALLLITTTRVASPRLPTTRVGAQRIGGPRFPIASIGMPRAGMRFICIGPKMCLASLLQQ